MFRTPRGAWRCLAAATALMFGALCSPADATPPARYTIAVHISHDKAPSTGPEEVDAIRDFIDRRVAIINRAGGVKGAPVDVRFFDDESDPAKTIANVDAALADPSLIAMVGLWNSSRGAGVIDRIGASGIPIVSELSVETLFAAYPNIYTLTRSVRDEQQVFESFAGSRFRRIALVGAGDDLYTRAYHQYLMATPSGASLVHTTWMTGNVADQGSLVDDEIAKIRAAEPDLVFLSIGSKRGAEFLARAAQAGLKTPVFIALGSINGLAAELARIGAPPYSGALYEVAEGGIANLNNERLEQLMRRPANLPTRTYSSYAVGYGARYADLVALIAEAANGAVTGEVATMRDAISRKLAGLKDGQRVWRGWAQDWSFTSERASSERSLLVVRPPGHAASILAPTQYVRTGAQISPVPVLYVHLHMVRVFRVDSAEKSFEAEFFFTIRSLEEVPISTIEFTNAYRGPGGAAPLINIREVHEDPPDADGLRSRVFKISGKFMFEPDLRKYPFDEQVFSISFQPAKALAPFLLQPPSEDVRKQTFAVDGWLVQSHYVGTNDLIIRSVAGALSDERIIPYYNFNYTWVMKRQVIDYILRVIVPLSFIMIVAYLANFIPRTDFEATIAIQVTALLSAIALYLALNQPSADDATLSDQIFVAAYASISVMIALSIAEVNTAIGRRPYVLASVSFVQVYVLPLATLGLLGYVIFLASSDMTLVDTMMRWARKV